MRQPIVGRRCIVTLVSNEIEFGLSTTAHREYIDETRRTRQRELDRNCDLRFDQLRRRVWIEYKGVRRCGRVQYKEGTDGKTR